MGDIAWLLGCGGLVFLMQPGFMCLESGLTRSKNSINVAVKNLVDFGISFLLFWAFGYALMFGRSWGGWIGDRDFFPSFESLPWLAAFFLFQAMFCGTATTIVSGAVAERLKFQAYLIISILISGGIYPLFGHWVWNGADIGNPLGWLGRMGFIDFAGSTVVHGIGGWVSLAALLVVGPRSGRFSRQKSHRIGGSNLPFSVLGTLLLWLGWMGFNGGSTLALDMRVPGIIANTILAGASGMLAAGAITWKRDRIPTVESLIDGSIAGLVAITAPCFAVTAVESVIIGFVGSGVMLFAVYWLERWQIDDAVDAVAIHGAAGVWGTISVALFGNPEVLATGLTRYQQLGVQVFGVSMAFIWAFGLTFLILWIINRIFPLRVSLEEEEIGLNVSEHQAKTELHDLFWVMEQQAKTQDLSLRVPFEPFTEVGYIAFRYNQVMDSVEGYAQQLQDLNLNLEQTVAERTAELSFANEELKQLDRLKDEFLANTSHELRTPLHGIIGIAEFLLGSKNANLTSDTRENIEIIAKSGRRLSSLIDDILDFAKLRRKTLQLQLRSLDLRRVLARVLAVAPTLIGNKDIQIDDRLTEDIPWVLADENRLEQIFYNLIGNAIKFTQSGTVGITAEIREFELLAVTVTDTGIGIPEEKLERIFEAFEQADGSISRSYSGTGLGLAVTKKLVELHEGEINVKSEVGVGSSFTFTLPISQQMSRDRPREIQETFLLSQPAITPTDLDSFEETIPLTSFEEKAPEFKILMVDDEPVNLQVLQNFLSGENYAIASAMNATAALEIIASDWHPDLILLDVMMPDISGYELAEKLRESWHLNELPIILITAKNQISDLVQGLEVGANDYLTKPILQQELLARIKTQLQLIQIDRAYNKFVPKEFLQALQKSSILDVELGDAISREMSVLFADIRDFTTISESLSLTENFKFINQYFSEMEPQIKTNHGFIDKYIGDGIMALFSGSADDALDAGIAMLEKLSQSNLKGEYPFEIRVGIGINTGLLMMGTVGGEERMDGTVISDAVNLASRVEGLTKVYQTPLLISHNTFLKLEHPEKYKIRLLDRVLVKGMSQPISVLEVFDADPPDIQEKKRSTKNLFEQALLQYFLEDYEKAIELLKTCLKFFPQDRVVHIYLERCQQKLDRSA
ncbi:MAG: ammonium transporter [Cyanobacteria bacterium SBLK]|nr:ammonium transporter [Cyanobacteria bacterium SBLK]